MKAYIGIDAGSSSIKSAVIDADGNISKSSYLKNRGLIETLKRNLEEIAGEYEVIGVGITGSGRKLVGMLTGADLVKSEVLAHTIGVLHYYPETRTLIDIGAEDSKGVIIREGILEDFVLNLSCSSGTGSFLEAIATRIGIPIEQAGEYALNSKNELTFSSKCGVFTQSAVVTYLNFGATKEDILWGVTRSLVENYLTMMQGKPLEPPFVYTGMTAKNPAIVKAFEEKLKHKVIVPEYCHLTGAIGIAFMTKRASISQSRFNGFKMIDQDYETRIRTAKGCENHCEILDIFENNRYFGSIGNRCDKCVR